MNNRMYHAISATLVAGGLVLVACLLPRQAAAALDLSGSIYHVQLAAEDLATIQDLLPEYGGLNPAFINNNTDPNVHLVGTGEVSVTFIDEGAGYKNSFGYFLFDDGENILYKQTIFSNASEVGGGGNLRPGDTVTLGTFGPGTHIGFWVQANGYVQPSGHTYYTLDQYNPDGLRHMAIINDVGAQRLVIGIEDLYNLGDKDYNDMVFTFQANPYSAIDTSRIPTGAPEAGPMATALICAVLGVAALRRRKAQGGASSHTGSGPAPGLRTPPQAGRRGGYV